MSSKLAKNLFGFYLYLNEREYLCSISKFQNDAKMTHPSVAEGTANACKEWGQTFADQMEKFITRRLRELSRSMEESTDISFREDREKAPPAVDYSVFLQALFSSHRVRGQGMQHPEAVSVKRRCLLQCFIPTIDLKNSFPDFNSMDFHDHKVLSLLVNLV